MSPLNREPELATLLKSYITPLASQPYDRNHGPIAHLERDSHTVKLDGRVLKPLTLTIKDLESLPQHEVICALQCAGNRRHTMRTQLKEVEGIDWFNGAVMNCRWRGPRIRDVLSQAGIADSMKDEQGRWKGHLAFACHAVKCQEDEWYGGSVALERAMAADGDCIFALEMNGEVLTDEHGAPVRAIIPGIAGARSVKWLDRVTVQETESDNFYQKHDYKVLPPEATDKESAEKWWEQIPPMMDMPINSVIGLPDDGSRVERNAQGTVLCKGYALPHGADGPVKTVEVSGDEGKTWTEAELDFGDFVSAQDLQTADGRQRVKWAWCLWTAEVTIEPGRGKRIVCRATDWGGNMQPQDCQWNLRGVGYNAWGEVHDLDVT